MKIIYLSLMTALLFTSCGEEKAKKGEVVSSLADGETVDKELLEEYKRIEKEELEREKQEKMNVTSLSFDRLNHDFGTIEGEKDHGTVFIVKNTGKKPLIIDEVKASCGCTTPQKPEKPILPGKTDKIVVNFRPTAEQKNEITKTITVAANTEPRLSTLSIRAFVK